MLSGKDLLSGMGYIDDDLVEEAEFDEESDLVEKTALAEKKGLIEKAGSDEKADSVVESDGRNEWNIFKMKTKIRRSAVAWLAVASVMMIICAGVYAVIGTDDSIESGISDGVRSVQYENPKDYDESNAAGEVIIKSSLPEGIIVIARYINYADGYQDRGSFIDGDGNVYTFDFSNDKEYPQPDSMSDKEFVDKLMDIRDTNEPQSTVDRGLLEDFFECICNTDWNADIIEDSVSFDAGQSTIYFYDERAEKMRMLQSRGDTDSYLDDDNAKEAVKVYEEMIKKKG